MDTVNGNPASALDHDLTSDYASWQNMPSDETLAKLEAEFPDWAISYEVYAPGSGFAPVYVTWHTKPRVKIVLGFTWGNWIGPRFGLG